MKRFITLYLLLLSLVVNASNKELVTGLVTDSLGSPLIGAAVYFNHSSNGTLTNEKGEFTLECKKANHKVLVATYAGYHPQYKQVSEQPNKQVRFTLQSKAVITDEVEVFGSRYKQPEKMDLITRMPLRPSEQIQSISVISEKMIAQQGNMTLSDATKNVVGVSTFATFGNSTESLSARGFRGIPVLKNGVRLHSDFRGQGSLSDMQGIESIQVIKGSAAVTQGIGNDLGSAGGVINIATKTPKFVNAGEVALRVGSWGQVRPTFDVQQVMNKKGNIAMRLNGAYERSDNYRKYVNRDRIYLNPSLAWKINPKSTLTVEMDYLHDTRTPDRGTVNLASDDIDKLYKMPNDKFLGYESDRVFTNQLTYSARFAHQLSDKLSLRMAVVGASLDVDNAASSTQAFKNAPKTGLYNLRQRSLGRSLRDDQNRVAQIDLIGRDIYTGKIKHTFQIGLDYKNTQLTTTAYKTIVVDTIDVLKDIKNQRNANLSLVAEAPISSSSYSYGLMAQDVITFNKYLKTVLGARYSYGNSIESTSSGAVTGDAFNPMLGVIVTPFKGFNLFGSYTNTTDLRSAANLMADGSPVGASTVNQFEAGLKSEWLDQRLRFNVTYFHVMNSNLSYTIYNDAFQSTGRYGKAGDLRRQGLEVEAIGRPLSNLQVVLGYAYLDAQYQDSPAYVNGSAPMNAPKHTANGWLYYTLDRSALKGLSIGLGAYYIGSRPVGDYTQIVTHANTTPGVRPFDMAAYTTVNATLGYTYKKVGINMVFNNILNEMGYSSYYRGGFINPIDPFNLSATISYRF